MKEYSLVEHWSNVSMWWHDVHEILWPKDEQMIFFIAYERWLNDRPLLTEEDGYEWKWNLPEGSWQSTRPGWIGPPTP